MSGASSPALFYLVYIAVAVGALFAFEGLRQMMSSSDAESEVRNRRMRMIAKGATTGEVLNLLRDDPARRSPTARLDRLLKQSGLSIGVPAMLVIMAGTGLVLLLFGASLLPAVLVVPVSLAAGILVPLAAVNAARKKRMARLVHQLPEALDLMSRALKVGHPLNVSIASVAAEMPDPIGTEFGIVEDQVIYGDTVVKALSDMADRVDLEDVRYLAVSVGIQHGSGGNLARVLQVLSKVIRDRAMMRKKIKAISSEGRFSATILSVIPFGIFGIISATSPSYYGDVWDDPLLLPILGFILGLVILQAFVLFRMVNFKF